MRLLLIRHGETVDNVAGNYAGTTDSPLTNHGVIQVNRLGEYLAANNIKTAHIFSSDLQRAFKTAEAIRKAQDPSIKPVTQLALLREQDFGLYEGKRFSERPRDSNTTAKDSRLADCKNESDLGEMESKQSMRLRADTFVDQHLFNLLERTPDDQAVVVVAHGIILSHLWRVFLGRFDPANVSLGVGVEGHDRGLGFLGGWSNTGYLELEITSTDSMTVPNKMATASGGKPLVSPETSDTPADQVALFESVPNPIALAGSPRIPEAPNPTILKNKRLVVKAVNKLEHLNGLKKTRGGIGSLKHDSSQKTMESFFKKRRLE